jgi:hypothetical protein
METTSLQSALHDLIFNCDGLGPLIDYPSGIGVTLSEQEKNGVLLKRAIAHIHNLSSKLALICRDEDDPTIGIPYVSQMSQAVTVLVHSAMNVIIEAEAGPYLATMIRNNVKAILNSVKNLALALKKKNYENDNIPRLTGLLWEACKNSESIHLDNKSSVLEALKLIEQPLRDAVNELEEELKNVNNESEEEEEEFDEDDPILNIKSAKLSQEDLEVLPGTIQIVKLSFMFVQRVEKIISMSTNDQNERIYGFWLSDLYNKAKDICEAVDNLCVAIEPPQDRSDLQEKFDHLTQTIISAIYIIRQNQISNRESVQLLMDQMQQKFVNAKLILPK